MAEVDPVIEPLKATLYVERKYTDGAYGSTSVGLHFPVELPNKSESPDEAAHILAVDAAIKTAFWQAKAHVFEQAGKTFEDKDGVILEMVLAALPGSTEVASPTGNFKPVSRPSAPVAGAPDECPACGGQDFWDNRTDIASGAKSPKSPTFKCKAQGCGKGIWSKGK